MTGLPPDIERVALLGWHVLPASATSKAACFPGAADAATCDLDVLETWAREFPSCNWRVVCGPSGLFALDVDRAGDTHHADGVAALSALVAEHGPIPKRPMTRTGGSGGAALFFAHRGEALRGRSGVPAPGLDPMRGRQAVMIPPSRHPLTGGAYTWRPGLAPWQVAPPPIPTWLAALLAPAPEPAWAREPWIPTSERARGAVMRAVFMVTDAPSGAANDCLNRAAFRLGSWAAAGLLTVLEAEGTLLAAAQARRIPLREARDTIRSGLRGGLRKPVHARG